jgi:uncharacterized phage protein (TIGR01671 family)
MREILFRGKRKDNGEWVEGFYGEFHNRPRIPGENSCQIFEPREDAYLFRSCVGGLWHVIDRETLGQFTGLTDKNGKKIFEGDVISCNGKTGYVNYDSGCFCVHEMGHSQNNPAIDIVMSINAVKIISNIHDDPELLEVENG